MTTSRLRSFDAARSRLNDLAALPDGWNGERAPAPSSGVIAAMRAVLSAAEADAFLPSLLVADVMGGVAAYWSGDETMPGGASRRVVSVNIDNDGDAAAIEEDRAADSCRAFAVDANDIAATLRRLRAFVGAES